MHLSSAVGFDGDVNIESVGGNAVAGANLPVDIAAQSVDVEVVQPTHDDLNCNANVQQADLDVSAGNALYVRPGTAIAFPVTDNGGSLTIDGSVSVTAVTPGTGATALGKAEDAVHTSGATGIMALAVRRDSGSALAADGDYIPLITDDVGRLRVTVGNAAIENAVVAAAHAVFPAGAVRDDVLGTLGVSDGDWTNLRVTDRGSLWVEHDGNLPVDIAAQSVDVEVVQPTHDDLNCNANIQVGNVDVSGGNPVPISGTVVAFYPYTQNSVAGGGSFLTPAGVIRDDALATLGSSDADWENIRCNDRGALWVLADTNRRTITNLFSSQVLNNTTTSANSSQVDATDWRWGVLYLDISASGSPTNVQVIPQFSNDGGTSWFDWNLQASGGGILWPITYGLASLPIDHSIPLDYVVGRTFRLRIVGTGTTASNTITVSAWVEFVT